jgi:hypothetical protein
MKQGGIYNTGILQEDRMVDLKKLQTKGLQRCRKMESKMTGKIFLKMEQSSSVTYCCVNCMK